MDKKMKLFEKNKYNDKTSHKTFIQIKDEDTGEVIFEGSNKVILAGSAFTAAKHFNISPRAKTPSYNTVLGLDNTVSEPFNEEGVRREEQVYLFAVGTNGCGLANSQVYDVDYSKWIAPEHLVPFRYQLATNDLNPDLRDKYFGRKTYGDHIIYYFKAFETKPELKQQYSDGTPIDENVYLSNRIDEIETFVETQLKITKEDCRDYFIATTGINDARINSISLLTAWKKTIGGYDYYQDIRPLTELHFPNEPLIDVTKGLDIIYQIYY